jgi:hypothetical protein
MKFKMSLIIEDVNGNTLDAFNPNSNTELEELLEKQFAKYPYIVGEEHLTVITLKVAVPITGEVLPEEAFEYPVEEIEEERVEETAEPAAPLAYEHDNEEE